MKSASPVAIIALAALLFAPVLVEGLAIYHLVGAFNELAAAGTADPESLAPHIVKSSRASRIALALAVLACAAVATHRKLNMDRPVWFVGVAVLAFLGWLGLVVEWLVRGSPVFGTAYVLLASMTGVALFSKREAR